MSKITLTDLSDLTNEISAVNNINNNSATIVTAFDNTLSRDGTSPNQMTADIDMNSNDLLNVGTIDTDNLVVSGTNLNNEVQAAADSATAAATSASSASTSAINAAASASIAQAAAASISLPIPISSGGTGQTTANTGLNALLPSQTGNSGKVLMTDGTNTEWSTVNTSSGPVNAASYGFVPGTGTDADLAAAITAAVASPSKILQINAGTYTGLLIEANFSALNGLEFLGPIFFDYSTASNAANFPDGALVYVGGAALTALPNLGSNATIGDCSVTFASASGLSSGDRFCIFNPTNSSWSGYATYYKAGEWCQVADPTSDPTLTLQNPLYDSYTTTAVSLYKHPNKKFSITGPGSLTIIDSANSALNSVASFRADRIVDSDFHAIHGTNSSYSAMLLNQCINITGTGYYGRQWRNVGTGTMYGLNIANCQDIIFDGDWYGVMNGSTLGGFATTGCVPNRNVRLFGTFKSSAVYGLFGAHMHGNSEYCYYSGTMFGVAVAGDHCGAFGTAIDETGNRTTHNGVVAIIEPLGFDFDFHGLHVESQLNNSAGIFSGHDSTSGFNANTVRGGVINLDNTVWDCPHAQRLIDIVNAGSTTTDKIVLSMNGLKWTATDATSPLILLSGLVSPATRTFDELHVAGVVNGPGAAWTLQLPCLVGGWSASGSVSLTTTTSVTSASASVTWARPAPKTPKIMLGVDAAVGGSRCIPFRSSASVTGATIGAETAAGANFASTAGGVVDYDAVLDEC